MRWRIWLFLVSKNEAKSEAPVIPSVLVACSEGARIDRAHHFFGVGGGGGGGGESYKYQPPWLVEDEKKKKHRLKHPKVVPKNKIWTKI